MKQFVAVLCASSALVLAACGGGGSSPLPSGGGGTPATATPKPTPTPTQTPSSTVARGTLVDDASGTPLAGVQVQVDPWIAYPTPGPTPTPIAVSTTDANGHFVVSEPNGTYLLVIGADAINTPPPNFHTPSPSETDTPIPGASKWQATVHDRIVLTGGGTSASPIALVAPTMPPQPLYTPPATETGGDYRLMTLDPLLDAPCMLAWNSLRASHGLAGSVADEWSFENARAIAWVGFQPNGAGQTVTWISTGSGPASGGGNCAQMLTFQWSLSQAAPWVFNAQTLWFGARYLPTGYGGANMSAYGAAESPVDPRVFPDPNGLVWP